VPDFVFVDPPLDMVDDGISQQHINLAHPGR
jgi:hypothetical protein